MELYQVTCVKEALRGWNIGRLYYISNIERWSYITSA